MKKRIWFLMLLLLVPALVIAAEDSLSWNGVVCAKQVIVNWDARDLVCYAHPKPPAVLDLGCTHNLITNRGKNLSASNLMGPTGPYGNSNYAGKIAIGENASVLAVTDIALPGIYSTCDLGIASSTLAWVSLGNFSAGHTWTSSCDSKTVTAAGLYNTTETGNLLAESAITSATLNTGDQLILTYYGAQT